ncbi:unnamed protein product [Penicillium pancosmium]
MRDESTIVLIQSRLNFKLAHELATNLYTVKSSLVIILRTAVAAEAMAKSAPDESRKATSKLDNHDVTNENASTEKKHKSESKDKKKRKSSSENGDDEALKKKRRHDESEAADESSQKKKKKTKKRVSFGPGTKTKDAEDSSDSDNDAGDESEADNNTAETSEEKEHEKALEDMKKRKREKKKERKSGAATTTTQVHETPILSYLNWYHRDRPSWKFQKNRESNIFKHLYSLEHVPAVYNVALRVYLQGLKGEASKMRLSQGAAEVMSVDKEVEADEEYHQAVDGFREYLTAGSEDIGASDSVEQFEGETRKRLQKRQRAELVFFAVTGKLYIGQKPMPPQRQEPPQPKKRKNRTVVVDISSSSESDGDSDNGKSSSKKKKAAKAKKADNGDDSTSSSGSDSSSSDSDNAPPRKKAAKVKPAPPTPEPKEPPAPSKNKKKQKRKMRTAQIEISSSESDSD